MQYLQIFLQYLPILMEAGKSIPEIIDYIRGIRKAAEQANEWTPELDELYRKSLDELEADPANQVQPRVPPHE